MVFLVGLGIGVRDFLSNTLSVPGMFLVIGVPMITMWSHGGKSGFAASARRYWFFPILMGMIGFEISLLALARMKTALPPNEV
ncbi:MAG: hypothetical protein D6679_14075, partial [Candidatus Hydrogenedentota bacterium]